MRIVQLLPTAAGGDAVSNDALALWECLKEWDPHTEIYAQFCLEGIPQGRVRPFEELPELGYEDVLIYHMSIGSPVSLRIDELRCRKVMIYHNITPPEYYAPYSEAFTRECRMGCAELERMRDWFDYCIADSEFNRQGLLEAGYTCPVDVCPVMISLDSLQGEPDAETVKKLGDGRTNVLFVGRVAPNKKQENVIRAFAAYQEKYDPSARLILAGINSFEAYKQRLWSYTRALGVRNVNFTGHISDAELTACYRSADVFLCMSEHEGFCVPLLEAMSFEVPVAALSAAAVTETLGEGGVLLESSDPAAAAEVLRELVRDGEKRRSLIEKGRKRLSELTGEPVRERFRALFAAFLAAPRSPRRRRVIQMVPRLSTGDAVSSDVLELRAVLRSFDVREDVWCCDCAEPVLRSSVRCSETAPEIAEDDVVLFHMAMGDKMAERFTELPCRRAVIYHSVTPAAFMEPYSASFAAACRKGKKLLPGMIAKAELLFADSEFDRQELLSAGARQVELLPLLMRLEKPAPEKKENGSRGHTTVLFVGRAAPNKRLENVIRAFSCYRHRYDPTARLVLAGDDNAVGGYSARLRGYIAALGEENVELTGKVSDAELRSLYAGADVFLCMSEHEGFCMPLVEAMSYDVPVAALSAAAVPETLGGSGVLLSSPDPEAAAEALHALMTDAEYREAVLAGQRERLRAFDYEKTFEEIRGKLTPLLGEEHEK